MFENMQHFHQHCFLLEDGTENRFACMCGMKIDVTSEVTPRIVENLGTLGFDLQNLPGGTEFVLMAPNGNQMPFRVATYEELLAVAEKNFDHWSEQVRILRQKIEEEGGTIPEKEEEEWPALIGD